MSELFDRRQFLGAGITAAAALSAAGALNTVSRPNVVFITTDQQRHDSLGCNGNDLAATPNLDALAAGGVNFSSCYVTQPVCSPCRSSLVTGQYPHRTGVIDNNIPLIDHSTSFPRLLHQAGYRTGFIGKWHLGPKGEGNSVAPPPAYFDEWQGYDTGASFWMGKTRGKTWKVSSNSNAVPDFQGPEPGPYRTDFETDQAIDFLKRNQKGPFFLWLSIYPPHSPWTAPLENCLRFKDKSPYPTYFGMINRIDDNIGRLLATLSQLGLRENTVVAFSADHGHNLVQRWNSHGKRLCYDSSARVPLIMSWKGQFRTGARSQLISSADIGPTLLDVCGVQVPSAVHGRSAKSVLSDPASRGRDFVVIQNRPYQKVSQGMFERCVVTADWKLILNTERAPELFNRKSDPAEEKNLYADPSTAGVRAELLKKLDTWAWEVNDGLALSSWLRGKADDES